MSRFSATACGVVLVFVAAGCGAAAASPDRSAAMAAPATTAPATTAAATPSRTVRAADVDDAVGRVDALGRSRFVAQYTGVEVAPDGVVVYRKPSAEFDAAIAALGLRAPVHLRDAAYSARELRALTERIAADVGYWQQRGVVIAGVGPCNDGSGVQVGLPEPGDAARLLTAHYGVAPPITVVERSMGVLAAEPLVRGSMN